MEEKAEKEKLKQLVLEINERQEEEEQALIGIYIHVQPEFLFNDVTFLLTRVRFRFAVGQK